MPTALDGPPDLSEDCAPCADSVIDAGHVGPAGAKEIALVQCPSNEPELG